MEVVKFVEIGKVFHGKLYELNSEDFHVALIIKDNKLVGARIMYENEFIIDSQDYEDKKHLKAFNAFINLVNSMCKSTREILYLFRQLVLYMDSCNSRNVGGCFYLKLSESNGEDEVKEIFIANYAILSNIVKYSYEILD